LINKNVTKKIMKLDQLNAQITADTVNEKFAQIFGEKVNLNSFTTEQLENTKEKVLGKLSQIQNAISFDKLSDSEDYQKQRMLLDLLDRALEERKTNEGGNAFDIAQGDAENIITNASSDEEAKADLQKLYDMEDDSYAQSEIKRIIDDLAKKGLTAMQRQLAMQDGPMEGNAFAQAVAKAKAAGMKPGDKFKVGDKDFTLKDAEDLLASTMNEKAKPDFLDMDKDGDKKEPMKKAMQDKKKKEVKEGAEDQAQLVMASKDMVDKITGWMEDTASMMSEGMLELTDAIRDELGSDKSEAFENQIKPALESLYSTLETTRDSLTGGVAIVTGEQAPTQMGAEPEVPAEEPASDDDMPDQADDFSASEPATGGEEPADRGKRESIARLSSRLAEVLSSSKKKA
jgi:hypothetical protein